MKTMREDFETAWMTRTGLTKPPARFPNGGDYVYPAANTAWWAWQAACAQSQQDALDAARYRWIREHGNTRAVSVLADEFYNDYELMQDDRLDEAVDAAMATQGASNV